MIKVDKEQGLARDHGEFWGPNDEVAQEIIVDMQLEDDGDVEFSYGIKGKDFILRIPSDRLKRLLR